MGLEVLLSLQHALDQHGNALEDQSDHQQFASNVVGDGGDDVEQSEQNASV